MIGQHSPQTVGSPAALCRLCGGDVTVQFRLPILGKYDVGFSRCSRCESLQTDEPFWLDEAYAEQRRFFDTGAVVRNQRLQAYLWWIVRLFDFPQGVTALDWGGGDGLFTRMMRDIGIDARHFDRYATNTYAAGFDDEPGRQYDIVTAFEVWEHLPDPGTTLDDIFGRRPALHFLTTSLYTGQGPEWRYIYPTTGKHIFFYSRRAMELVAERYGYSVLTAGGYTLFYNRPLSPVRRRLLELVLSSRREQLVRSMFALKRGTGLVDADRKHFLKLRG